MISVVIPLYNKSTNIFSTVNSVITQDYQDFELIIVNDGSTDNSLEIAKSINDKRIRIIDKKNGGVSSARNTGILAANFEYIAFLDGDDFWFPNHLKVLNLLIKQFGNTASGFVTRFEKLNSLEVINRPKEDNETFLIKDYFKEAYNPITILSSSNFVVKKELAINAGLYDTTLRYGEDVEFWYRLFNNQKIAVSNQITVIYFIGAENRSNVKIIPLHHRFSDFDFDNKTKSEQKYLGKLVCLIIIDYTMQRAYGVAFKVFWKYKKHIFLITGYFAALVKKWINKKFRLSVKQVNRNKFR